MSRNNNRGRFGGGGGGGRQGAKQISKNRFAKLDADIVSAYDDDDDQPIRLPSRDFGVNRVLNHLAGTVLHGPGGRRTQQDRKKDRQQFLGSAGRNAEIVNKVKVPNGRKYGLPWVMNQLSQQVEDFKPLLASITDRGDIEFFLKSDDAAEAVRTMSRRTVHKLTGERVTFFVDRQTAPWSRLKKDEIDIINKVVDSCWHEEHRALDLSEFASNQVFKQHDLDMKLNKNNVMLAVMDRIDERYGGLAALSLKGNRLRFLDYAAMLTSITKHVKVLDISNNQIESLEQLHKLKGLPVTSLCLEGNPVCEQLTKSTEYRNAVQLVFPKCTELDGEQIPPSPFAGNEHGDEQSTDPVPRWCYFGPNQQTVDAFLTEFFQLYDGENGATTRKNLMQAYEAENSTFTLSFGSLNDTSAVRYHDNDCFNNYVRAHHNIMQQDRWARARSTRTTKGAMDIVVALSKLPMTNHYPESFIVDVHLQTATLLGFTVQGLFEDGTLAANGQVPTLNYFSRSFVVTARNEGVVVVSDMLYISGILPERLARYNKLITKCRASPSITIQSGLPSEQLRQEMLAQFCKDSGMLPEWSLKCLDDANWNYENAGQMFLSMRQSIPPEAFAPKQ